MKPPPAGQWKDRHRRRLLRHLWQPRDLLWLLLLSLPLGLAAQGASEQALLLRAAFVFNFGKFTYWPEQSLASSNTPLQLCLSGRDEVQKVLKRLQGKSIKGHRLTVKELSTDMDIGSCQMLYIAKSEWQDYRKTLQMLGDSPVLTVSEIMQFAQTGGMIELYRQDGRLKFYINRRRAMQSGLTLDSRLLSLAVIIDEPP